VVVTDPLPAGLRFVSVAANRGIVSEKVINGVVTITWNVGALRVGTEVEMVIVTLVTASSGSIVNTAVETQTTRDPSGQSKSSTASAVVTEKVPPVVVPPSNTGEPWAGWPYWLLVILLGLIGAALFEAGRRRRRFVQ
jgi:hypothetical protein